MILQVWARKASLFVHDCLSGFLITIITAFLVSKSGKNRISSSMNAMQILRITLDFIGMSAFYFGSLLINVFCFNYGKCFSICMKMLIVDF